MGGSPLRRRPKGNENRRSLRSLFETFGRRYFWGYLRLILSVSWINTRKFYESVANSIARKGVQRVNDPLAGSRGSAPCFPINTRKQYAVVTNSIARKGQGRNSLWGQGAAPFGFPNKHAKAVCSRHQLNRAKGSREELPCGVKGQRPLVSINHEKGSRTENTAASAVGITSRASRSRNSWSGKRCNRSGGSCRQPPDGSDPSSGWGNSRCSSNTGFLPRLRKLLPSWRRWSSGA